MAIFTAGLFVGFGIAIAAALVILMIWTPALEDRREQKIVDQVVHKFQIPEVPPYSRLVYALQEGSSYHGHYGFEFHTDSADIADRWIHLATMNLKDASEVTRFHCAKREPEEAGSSGARVVVLVWHSNK